MSFFFSSRRRHTRCLSDWSSDVCSSDLSSLTTSRPIALLAHRAERARLRNARAPRADLEGLYGRSEERRVGKECRSGWSPSQSKKNTRTTKTKQRQAQTLKHGDISTQV